SRSGCGPHSALCRGCWARACHCRNRLRSRRPNPSELGLGQAARLIEGRGAGVEAAVGTDCFFSLRTRDPKIFLARPPATAQTIAPDVCERATGPRLLTFAGAAGPPTRHGARDDD